MPRLPFPAVSASLFRFLAVLLAAAVLLQSAAPAARAAVPAPAKQFEGASSSTVPLSLAGEVGPNHYVQWVNGNLYVWTKSGIFLHSEVPGSNLWAGIDGNCHMDTSPDADVAYDAAADRWVVVKVANDGFQPDAMICAAVSKTSNPAGEWNLFDISWTADKKIHEPHLAVWDDSYLVTLTETSGDEWAGSGVAVLKRDPMLAGLTTQSIQFDLESGLPEAKNLLPADLDGGPAGYAQTPPLFAAWQDGAADALLLWQLDYDWAQPAQAVFGAADQQPNAVVETDDWSPLCANAACIPQPGTDQQLNARSGMLSDRLQLRENNGSLSLTGSLTVDAGAGKAGLAWFILENNTSGWTMSQQGVYSHPKFETWLPAAATDKEGNLALGYAASSSEMYPSLEVTGRLAEDPLNELPQGETQLVTGDASNLVSSGWSLRSSLSVDPSDDCTFWYSNAVMASTGVMQTHIFAFRYANCGLAHPATVQGVVRDSITSAPVAGVKIQAGAVETFSAADGSYTLRTSAGAVSVTYSRYGYYPQSLNLTLVEGTPLLQDVSLVERPLIQVSGVVTDGSGHSGMPLYARVQASSDQTVYTDPFTGGYQMNLYVGESSSLTVTALSGGYHVSVHLEELTESTVFNFALPVDISACIAPGYTRMDGTCSAEPGGLVSGFVQDANNPPNPLPVGLVGSVVSSGSRQAATVSTVDDSALPEGFFQLFLPAGETEITASREKYQSQTKTVTVVENSVAQTSFNLPAGYLAAAPDDIQISVPRNHTTAVDVVLSNPGGAALTATFDPAAAAWLAVPSGSIDLAAGAQQTVQVSVNTQDLELGTYTTSLSLQQDTPYSFGNIPVELTVIPGHSLAVARGTYSVRAASGGTARVVIPVLNDGDFDEEYQVEISGGGWSYSAPASLPVAAGQTGWFEFSAGVPWSTPGGASRTWTIAFTSPSDAAATRAVELTVTSDNRVFIPFVGRP